MKINITFCKEKNNCLTSHRESEAMMDKWTILLKVIMVDTYLSVSFSPVEQICKTCEKSLLGPLVFRLVLEHLISEGFAEVQSLEHRVGVASVAKVDESKIMFIGWKQI